MSEKEHLVKICVIGSHTELNQKFGRLTANSIPETDYLLTLGSDIPIKRMILDNKEIKLIIVVLSGKELFSEDKPDHTGKYRGASGCVILFDKGDVVSFQTVSEWYQEFRKTIYNPSVPIGIVGIKSKKEAVTTDEGKLLTEQLKAVYYETAIDDERQIDKILRKMAYTISWGN